MNSRLTSTTALILAFALPSSSVLSIGAQGNDEDEIFELSPFTVDPSPNIGYRSTNSTSGTSLNSKIQDSPKMTISGASIEGIEIGDFSQFGPDTGVRIRFAVGFYDDEEKVRRDTLNRYLDEIAAVINVEKDVLFESGAILVPEGDKRWSRGRSRADFASFAHFSVSFATPKVDSPFEKVRSLRRMVGQIKFDSKDTKIFYGQAQLVDLLQSNNDPIIQFKTTISGIDTKDPHNLSHKQPNVPVFLIQKADAVQFTVSTEFRSDNRESAETSINSFLDTLSSEYSSSSKVDLLIKYVNVTQSDKTVSISDKSAEFQARANASVLFKLDEQTDPRARVLQLKRTLHQQAKSLNAHKIDFDQPRLVLENPDKHRSEIMKKVAADAKALEDALGGDFEVELTFKPGRVKVWQHSDSEAQLWIPYSSKVVSKREQELEALALTRAHEVAMKDTRPQIVCCGETAVD
ncbi:hypothetical protein MLD52_05005 [Puniceicoccaceae bacterium K14]|nr:hypothetical protein [Puniceicoccaceae bacterium K14]